MAVRKKISDPTLKTYLDATKAPSLLVGKVDRFLQTQEGDRDQTVIHPSETVQWDWCPRATWHRLRGDTMAAAAPHSLKTMSIFEEGHDIHGKWQRWLQRMGILWGQWWCSSCGQTPMCWSSELDVKGCSWSYDNRHRWHYREVPFDWPSHRIKGHADGVVDIDGEPVLLEVKSLGPGTLRKLHLIPDDGTDGTDQFGKISHPAKSHFLQTEMYLRLVEQYEEILGEVRRAVIIYEQKADQQYKEFVVTRLDKWSEPMMSTALDIVWALDNGREMACPHSGCKYCKAYESAEA